MKAGRELDALIHKSVFNGQHKAGFNDYGMYVSVHWSQIPHYSTNISDAWLVVEKLGRFDMFYHPEIVQSYQVKLWSSDGTKMIGKAYAETAPLAISLAALKACGVEVEG
jgi:hypothetical protein